MQREANNCQEVKSHNESDIMEKRAVARLLIRVF